MPECYTHSLIGNRALMRSGQLVSSLAPFLAGTNGPDPFYFYQFLKKDKNPNLPKLAEKMHREKTGQFLNTLVHFATTPTQQSYVLGFMAHYATDCVMHPYIEALLRQQKLTTQPYAHEWLETSIDSELYFTDYKTRAVPVHMGTPVLITEDLAQVATLLQNTIKEVYNVDVPSVVLADTFHNLLRIRKAMYSRFGIKKVAAFLFETIVLNKKGKAQIRSHMQPGRPLKDIPSKWKNPYTMEDKKTTLEELVSEATEASAICISGTMRFWLGKMPAEQLATLLADNDYYTGQPSKEFIVDPIPNTGSISINKIVVETSEAEEAPIAGWKKAGDSSDKKAGATITSSSKK